MVSKSQKGKSKSSLANPAQMAVAFTYAIIGMVLGSAFVLFSFYCAYNYLLAG